MYFDGVVSKEGLGVVVWILNSQTGVAKEHSYKLNFNVQII